MRDVTLIAVVLLSLLGTAHADTGTKVAILYAEGASDPEGWIPKLNTYEAMRRSNESLEDCMKRVSSAYRTRSKQFVKAQTGDLNGYEKQVYMRLYRTVETFQPDRDWKYIHHESPHFYKSYEAMIKILKTKWGPKVDYENPIKIGQEYYFKMKEA